MNPLFFIFFAYFPKHLKASLVINRYFLWFNQYFSFIAFVLFFIAFFGSCCFYKPKRRNRPSCVLIFFHFLAALSTVIAAFLGYAGTNILSYKTNKNEKQANKQYVYDFILDVFQENKNFLMNIYENDCDQSSAKSLINITKQYNSTFSDINGIYRTSFNNIYFDKNTNKNLKVSLSKMDISRKNILSQIISFTSRFQGFSKSIQNTLNENFFVPVEKSHKVIKIGLNYSLGNIAVINNMFVADFSYILASVIILFTVLYSVCFFCNNCCSRCCFCIYPLFAFIIAIFTTLTCFFIKVKDYEPWNYVCDPNYYPNNKIGNLYNVSNISSKASFEHDSFKEIFNEKDINELIQKINSRCIHENYISIYEKYIPNPKYKNDLTKMVQVIEEKENDLKKMKDLIIEISNISHSVYTSFKMPFNISNQQINLRRSSLSSESIFCGKYLNGINCCVIAQFLLLIGLILMLFSVCVRRKGMGGGHVSKAKEFDHYVMGDEVDAVYNFNYASTNNQNSDDEQESVEDMYKHLPLSIDECNLEEISEGYYKTVLGIRLVYHATTYEAAQNILKDMYLVKGSKGMFGAGIYFAATMEIAKHKCRTNVGAYVIAKVDFGTALIRCAPEKTLTLDEIKRYGCDSVMGRSGPNTNWEFIVYESERTWPLKMMKLKERDIDNIREEEFSEGENDDSEEEELENIVTLGTMA